MLKIQKVAKRKTKKFEQGCNQKRLSWFRVSHLQRRRMVWVGGWEITGSAMPQSLSNDETALYATAAVAAAAALMSEPSAAGGAAGASADVPFGTPAAEPLVSAEVQSLLMCPG
jgi:hypothetical protein